MASERTKTRAAYKAKQEKKWLPCGHFNRHEAHGQCPMCTRRERLRKWRSGRCRRLTRQIIELLGGTCVCCGEDTPEFLTIDHVHKNGAEERRKQKGGPTALKAKMLRAIQAGSKDYRVLCWNCNCAIGVYGTCPHKWKGEA